MSRRAVDDREAKSSLKQTFVVKMTAAITEAELSTLSTKAIAAKDAAYCESHLEGGCGRYIHKRYIYPTVNTPAKESSRPVLEVPRRSMPLDAGR